MQEQDIILELKNVSKSFPGVKAIDNVSVSFKKGEVHALVGENGAGKSTLIKMITGIYEHDSGEINYYYNGQKREIKNPIEAKEMGIQVVHQDLVLAPSLSVGENFFIGKIPRKNGFVDWKGMYRECSEILKDYDIDIDPKERMERLTLAQRGMLSIAKLAHNKAKVAIFDEPTALLTSDDTVKLFKYIERLKNEGVAVLYVSHRLEEIIEICDKATVLKDGAYVTTVAVADVDEDKLISLMVGRKIEEIYDIKRVKKGKTILDVQNLNKKGVYKDINFSVKSGEILGFFGLVGAGRTEVMRAVYGADHYDSGKVFVNGKPVAKSKVSDAAKKGLGLVPEDRRGQGLAPMLSVKHNINAADYKGISKAGFVSKKAEIERGKSFVQKLDIKTPSINKEVQYLSGGNQQKVVISKVLCKGADIVIFDEPTVGVDVGAKKEIYSQIEAMIHEGKAVVIISSYLPEVLGLSDRVLVMSEGQISGEATREELLKISSNENEEKLLKMASKTNKGE